MNALTVLIGVAAILFGLYTFYLRANDPAKLGKLAAMQKQWGESTGKTIHTIAYSVVPIIVGLIILMTGLEGGSLF